MSRSWLIRIVVVLGLVAASSVAVIATGSAAQAAIDPTLPTISEAFGASTIVAGATSTVDFTITNTAAGSAQSGLAFTDTLPTGLTPLDSGPAPSSTCATGANLKVDGQQISVDTLTIDAGSASCTVSFGVQAATAGTFTNEPADITSTTLNLPTSASVLTVSDATPTTPTPTTTTTPTKVTPKAKTALAPAAQATAPTTWSCTNAGLLFQTPRANSHTVTQVNLVNGTTTPGTNTTDIVNGLGFNVLDNYIYGWDNATFSLVRIGQNGVVQDLGNPPGVIESGTNFDGYPMGDVDPQGHLWWADDQTGQWYEIDVDQTSSTFGDVLAQGVMAVPAIGLPSDWAYINGSLYGVVGIASQFPHLFQFNTSTHVMTDLGQASGGGIGGQSQFFGAAYTVTQADLDAGGLTNTATVSGTTPGGPTTTSPPSRVTVPSTATGVLDLIKVANAVDENGNGVVDAGDLIVWTFVVTNTGTATVTAIAVSDPTAGAVSCPQTSLAPGQSMTCAAPAHIVTQADVTRGRVVNTAVSTGSFGGVPTDSNTATATVTVRSLPPVALASTGVIYGPALLGAGVTLLLIGLLVMLAGVRRRPGAHRTS